MILIAYYVLRTPQYRQGISQQRYCSTLPPVTEPTSHTMDASILVPPCHGPTGIPHLRPSAKLTPVNRGLPMAQTSYGLSTLLVGLV